MSSALLNTNPTEPLTKDWIDFLAEFGTPGLHPAEDRQEVNTKIASQAPGTSSEKGMTVQRNRKSQGGASGPSYCQRGRSITYMICQLWAHYVASAVVIDPVNNARVPYFDD